jgi:hypothetical protein
MKPLDFQALVQEELDSARYKHGYPPFNSLHEGYAILLEEVEELWAEVKKKPSKRDRRRLCEVAVQVAAMVQRLAEDLGLLED